VFVPPDSGCTLQRLLRKADTTPMLGMTLPKATLTLASSPLLAMGPSLVFVLSLLLVGVLCAGAAVGLSLLAERVLARKARIAQRPSRRMLRAPLVWSIGLVLGFGAWSAMTLVPSTGGMLGSSGWGIVAAAALFGIAALAKGVLRAPGGLGGAAQRPQSGLGTQLSQRTAA
jgi:hypothetical protein